MKREQAQWFVAHGIPLPDHLEPLTAPLRSHSTVDRWGERFDRLEPAQPHSIIVCPVSERGALQKAASYRNPLVHPFAYHLTRVVGDHVYAVKIPLVVPDDGCGQ